MTKATDLAGCNRYEHVKGHQAEQERMGAVRSVGKLAKIVIGMSMRPCSARDFIESCEESSFRGRREQSRLGSGMIRGTRPDSRNGWEQDGSGNRWSGN